jgi:hypothetical protein
VGQRNLSARRTGGGIDSLPQLDPLDERLISLLGGSIFATGNPELRAPFMISMVRYFKTYLLIK